MAKVKSASGNEKHVRKVWEKSRSLKNIESDMKNGMQKRWT